jgi:hypothetical protein
VASLDAVALAVEATLDAISLAIETSLGAITRALSQRGCTGDQEGSSGSGEQQAGRRAFHRLVLSVW